MMRKIGTLILALAMVFTYSTSTKAELIDRGGGLIYDTDLDITWLQDANYASTELNTAWISDIITKVGYA